MRRTKRKDAINQSTEIIKELYHNNPYVLKYMELISKKYKGAFWASGNSSVVPFKVVSISPNLISSESSTNVTVTLNQATEVTSVDLFWDLDKNSLSSTEPFPFTVTDFTVIVSPTPAGVYSIKVYSAQISDSLLNCLTVKNPELTTVRPDHIFSTVANSLFNIFFSDPVIVSSFYLDNITTQERIILTPMNPASSARHDARYSALPAGVYTFSAETQSGKTLIYKDNIFVDNVTGSISDNAINTGEEGVLTASLSKSQYVSRIEYRYYDTQAVWNSTTFSGTELMSSFTMNYNQLSIGKYSVWVGIGNTGIICGFFTVYQSYTWNTSGDTTTNIHIIADAEANKCYCQSLNVFPALTVPYIIKVKFYPGNSNTAIRNGSSIFLNQTSVALNRPIMGTYCPDTPPFLGIFGRPGMPMGLYNSSPGLALVNEYPQYNSFLSADEMIIEEKILGQISIRKSGTTSSAVNFSTLAPGWATDPARKIGLAVPIVSPGVLHMIAEIVPF